MFCGNCGKQIEDGIKCCPNCGAGVDSGTSQRGQVFSAGSEKNFWKQPDGFFGKNSKAKKWLLIIAAVLVVILFIAYISSDTISDKLISSVQNGYLGDYDMVTIKEVLEYACEGEWNAGEGINGGNYIVEYKGESFTIQFTIADVDAEDFKVSGLSIKGVDTSSWQAYNVKVYLDYLYGVYAEDHPNKGVVMDTSTSNDTLRGHSR